MTKNTAVNWMKVGKAIQTARKSLNMTQIDLAKHLNVARTTIVAIEAGSRKLKPWELLVLEKIGFPNVMNENANKVTNDSEGEASSWVMISPDEYALIKAYRENRLKDMLKIAIKEDS